jgi:hypothetical protein
MELGLIKTAALMENRQGDSARFWTASTLCRFWIAGATVKSGRGLPQSKTLARNSTAYAFSVATGFLKPL